MATSWTASDIEALEAAIKGGALRVRFSDGKEIQYHSLSDMLTLLRTMREEVSGVTTGGAARTTLAVMHKG